MPVEQPVDGENDGDVLRGQPDRVQYHDHSDQAGLRDAGGADGGGGGCDGDGHHLADGDLHLAHLGDEDGGHRLVQCGAVHVDGGADGKDEPGGERGDLHQSPTFML